MKGGDFMKPDTKRNIIIITVNTLVMIGFFLIKFVLLPRIPNIQLTSSSSITSFLNWVVIPLIFIIGLALEQQRVLFWIIPDFVYCALSFAISEKVHDYGIGVVGFFTTAHYSRDAALIDRLLTFALLLIMQFAVKLLIKLIKKVGGKSKS